MTRNFEPIVLDAYRWLADHYEDGDRIYLFGEFARLGLIEVSHFQASPEEHTRSAFSLQ